MNSRDGKDCPKKGIRRMTHRLKWIGIIVCILVLAGCAEKEPPIIKLIKLMQDGEYDAAIEFGEKLVKQNPDNSQAHRFLLSSAMNKGMGEEYRAKYEELVKANPTTAGNRFGLGYILTNLGNFDAAVLEFEKALELNPEIEHAHYMLGSIYMRPDYANADPEKALSEWEKEVQLNPQSLGALQVYTARADYYLRMGEAEGAEKDYEKIAMYAFAPGDRESARTLITRIRALRDELARLEAEAREKPDDPGVHYQLGIVQYNNAKIREAIETWQRASELNPTDANTRNYLGKALLEEGRKEEAIEQFQKVIELDPNMAAAYYNLAVAEESVGKTAMAAEHYKKYLELNPVAPMADQIKQRITVLEGETATEEKG